MKASVRIAKVYNEILEEERIDLVIVKNRKSYVGALFFRKDPWDVVRKVLDRKEVEGSAWDVMLEAYKLMKKHGRIAKDDQTFKCMIHWQFVNGFSDEPIYIGYEYRTDTELFESLKQKGDSNDSL